MPKFRSGDNAIRFLSKLLKAQDPIDQALSILVPLLEDHWNKIAEDALRQLFERVTSLEDSTLSNVPDALVRDRIDDQDEAVQDLVLALVGALRLRLATPPPDTVLRVAERLTRRLALEGARLGSLELELGSPGGAARLLEGSDDLAFAVRARLAPARLRALTEHVRLLVTNRPRRQLPLRRRDWMQEARDLLGIPASSWLPIGVEAWAVRWRSIGAVQAAQQSGVRRLVARNPLDHRTSTFCRWVHGRVILVEDAQDQLDRYFEAMRADDADAAFSAWPLLQIRSSDGPKEFEAYAEGIGLPPYHPRCRTEPVPA